MKKRYAICGLSCRGIYHFLRQRFGRVVALLVSASLFGLLHQNLAGFLPFVSRRAGTGAHPQSGDTTTVKQVGRDFGPSQRFTMDWSNIDGSTENIVLGESGNPFSPWFRDQWNDWYGGTTFALPFSPAVVAAQTRHTLRLLP